MIPVDVPFVAEQMAAEARRLAFKNEPPTCYWCEKPGPGLYWLPSEEGVIEMPMWNCSRCVARHNGFLQEISERYTAKQ